MKADPPEFMLSGCFQDWNETDTLAAKDVFICLWNLFSLYDITDCFNRRQDTGKLDGAEEFFKAEIESVYHLTESVEDIQNRCFLQRIVCEAGHFVSRYERPGVDDRWLSINPRLGWFDPVFDLADALPAEEMARLEAEGYFRVPAPTPWEINIVLCY